MSSGIGESDLSCLSLGVWVVVVSGGHGDLKNFAATVNKGQLCSHIPADAYLFRSLMAQQLTHHIVAIFGNGPQREFESQSCHLYLQVIPANLASLFPLYLPFYLSFPCFLFLRLC